MKFACHVSCVICVMCDKFCVMCDKFCVMCDEFCVCMVAMRFLECVIFVNSL